MTEKLIRDGKVAVLCSASFDEAGWSTWGSAEDAEKMAFCPELVEAVIAGDKKLSKKIAEDKFPQELDGGVYDLEVEWVQAGRRFKIKQNDGYEYISFNDADNGYIA